MKTKDVLIAARELISDEARWTRGAYARRKDGLGTLGFQKDAKCWCSLGAIMKIADTAEPEDHPACWELEKVIEDEVSVFNDTHTHAEVLAAFDRAIAACGDE